MNKKELNIKNISEIIDNYKTKYKEGFTSKEIKSLIKEYNLDSKKFYESLGVNTCAIIDDEVITYHCDIKSALYCILENRDKHLWEWD